MRVRWAQIAQGKPVEDGRIVDDVGMVFVTAEDEQEAADLGGNPWVELADATAASSRMRQWSIGMMTPAS